MIDIVVIMREEFSVSRRQTETTSYRTFLKRPRSLDFILNARRSLE